MTALLSINVDLVTSTFYQKRGQAETAKTPEEDGGYPWEKVLRQNLFCCQRANCLNYREAVSFILPIQPIEKERGNVSI
jgi:hypothetical protein